MTGRGHVEAFIQTLAAGVPGSIPIYDGAVPDLATPPYYAVYGATPIRSPQTLSALSDWQDGPLQITSAARTPQQAGEMAARAADAVVDKRPTIAGRTSGPVRHQASVPVQRDDQETGVKPVFYAVDTYALSSVPAPT